MKCDGFIIQELANPVIVNFGNGTGTSYRESISSGLFKHEEEKKMFLAFFVLIITQFILCYKAGLILLLIHKITDVQVWFYFFNSIQPEKYLTISMLMAHSVEIKRKRKKRKCFPCCALPMLISVEEN